MGITTDRRDPGLRYTKDQEPVGQHEKYLVLSEKERAKGWVRPLRHSYKHVGVRPKCEVRNLTPEEHARYDKYGYVKYEEYPSSDSSVTGRFWTKEMLTSGCNSVTRMGTAIAETYAKNPEFYGGTFCCGCNRHFPLEEFIWLDEETGSDTGLIVGS